jgi:diguanylate cyclase (GGDEF)-like protein
VQYKIRKLRAVEDGYFWINEILDYDGGDNYARRFVHPNLPETEGTYLSTEIRDIEGRLPYLAELEGVKKDGELFQIYQFKKPGTEEIGLKLSYAKLYADFNWIVATGVYLDDIKAQVAEKRSELERRQRRQFLALSGFTLLVLSASIGAILAAGRRHYAAIADQADRDILTGIGNRRAGQDRLIQTIAKQRRSNAGFCVLLCDLDHFKKINDAHGHAAGDAVLKTAAAAFSSELRALDSAFRWGGEEFLFIIADAAADEGARAAERLRERLESAAARYEGVDIAVTATFGVAAYAGEEDYQDLVRRADAAMYRGKAEGRNRVVVAAD